MKAKTIVYTYEPDITMSSAINSSYDTSFSNKNARSKLACNVKSNDT